MLKKIIAVALVTLTVGSILVNVTGSTQKEHNVAGCHGFYKDNKSGEIVRC